MTTARFFAAGNLISGFRVEGHSGYAPEGEDIVCAAVSAIAQAAVLGLSEVLGLSVRSETDEKRGMLTAQLINPTRESQILFETMKRAMQSIAKDYPDYVKVICENGGIRI